MYSEETMCPACKRHLGVYVEGLWVPQTIEAYRETMEARIATRSKRRTWGDACRLCGGPATEILPPVPNGTGNVRRSQR